MHSHDDDIIVAQCTPQGKGALALLRVSGTGVRTFLKPCIRLGSGKSITEVPTHTIHHGWVTDAAGTTLDEVMVIVMDAPRTFTGTDVIEITSHNNPFLIEMLIERILSLGARLAQEGEFTRRAFMHGKIDLIQVEAINDLIGATTQLALKKSLSQLEGSFSYWVSHIEEELIRTLAWCEASFEFLDEEAEFSGRITENLQELLKTIANLKKSFNAQQQIRQGIKIAIIGSVNAGKSSLFNALLNQKRAIVTDIAGTTRDAIEATLSYKGNFWTLIDTAGLRQTDDIIEQEGIRRSHEEAHKADIIILVYDRSRALTGQEKQVYADIAQKYPSKTIPVYNKADIPAHQSHDSALAVLEVSSQTHEALDKLYSALENKIAELFESFESPFLLNQRHHALLVTVEEKIKTILNLLKGSVQYEIVSYHVQDTLTMLTELTGKSISEAGLDKVFKEFCVGK